MRLLVIACAALPISAATAEPPEPAKRAVAAEVAAEPAQIAPHKQTSFVALDPEKQCPEPLVHQLDPREPPEAKKLTELPPADAYHAVYRRDAYGCIDPVMVGYQHRSER